MYKSIIIGIDLKVKNENNKIEIIISVKMNLLECQVIFLIFKENNSIGATSINDENITIIKIV